MKRQTKALRRIIACLIIGAIANVLVAWLCMFVVPLKVDSEPDPGEWTDGEGRWTTFRIENRGGLVLLSFSRDSFATDQLEPDIDGPAVLEGWTPLMQPVRITPLRIVEQRGWPWRSLSVEISASLDMSDPGADFRIESVAGGIALHDAMAQPGATWPQLALPLRPIWPGMLLNTLLYAAVVWAALFAPGVVRSQLRRMRIGRGECEGCGYPEVHAAERCPECGASWRERHRRA